MTKGMLAFCRTLLLTTGLSIAMADGAMAQDAGAAPPADEAGASEEPAGDEIIVTARKRDETLMEVPVVVTALSGATLERRGIAGMDALARSVPQLNIGEGGGTVQGGVISLRGISGAESNALSDQAVSFVFDGVQVARATVRRLSEMDLAQIEVLKGPQALFFGKNSPGGVINIRTADPTDTLTAKVSAAYEFNAREWRGEGYVAGPLTDALGFRIAAFGSTMKGWSKTVVPSTNPLQPRYDRAPHTDEWAVRGTLKFEPSDRFDARLKVTYNKRMGDGTSSNVQFVNCPLGTPNIGGRLPSDVPLGIGIANSVDNCKADDRVSVADPGTGYGVFDPRFAGGKTFLDLEQTLAGLEMNYNLTDTLKLTSVTGYYRVNQKGLGNFSASYIPEFLLPSYNFLNIREISQEVRLASDFGGPGNFTLGGFYQDTRAKTAAVTFLGTPGYFTPGFTLSPALAGIRLGGPAGGPVQLNDYFLIQDAKAYSLFGQVMIDLTPTLELSAGARYSHEEKDLPFLEVDTTGATAGTPPGTASRLSPRVRLTPLVDHRSFNNLSPEVTLSWRPSRQLTVFGSYKEGFLSGGFNANAGNFTTDLTYDQQLVKGFETGIKTSLLDRALRMNLALYSYKITGLQVTVATAGTVTVLTNAGSVRTKGAEFDFDYRTPIEGLSLNGALTYGRGRYIDYQASCYRGQHAGSPVPCLSQTSRVTGQVALLQDLSGTELLRAPEWAGNVGFDLERPVSSAFKIGLSGNVSFSSSYLTDANSKPAARSPSYALIDAGIRIADPDDRWEAALIGRNLTNEKYWSRNIDNPFSGTAPTGTVNPAAVLGDTVASVNRAREVMLRLTYRFN